MPWLPSLLPLNSLVVPGMGQELDRHPNLYIPEGLAELVLQLSVMGGGGAVGCPGRGALGLDTANPVTSWL